MRAQITPAEASQFRDFTLSTLEDITKQMGLEGGWWYSDEEREALRIAETEGLTGDVWIFGYGSLMWDPSFHFVEVRRAFAPAHKRSMTLLDTRGARGTADQPGLMAALEPGEGCNGLAFRIAAEQFESESRVIWQRERLAPAYRTAVIPLETAQGPIDAVTFLADPSSDFIADDLSYEQQLSYLATGHGFAGTSLDYLRNIVAHFEEMGIDDPEMTTLLADAEAWAAAHTS